MWAIGVKYLRGVCVATDSGRLDKPEWPPHESRLFMAMAATHFEMRDAASPEPASERIGLEWLEKQSPPRVFASPASTRSPVTVFVPVNDSTRADQLFADQRSRQPRHFPTSIPRDDEVYFVWDGDLPEGIRNGLDSIAMNVGRLGHSSSIVQVWVEPNVSEEALVAYGDGRDEWRPAVDGIDRQHFRVVANTPGMLAKCEANLNLAAIEEFVGLESEIKAAKGKAKKELKEQLAKQYPIGMPLSVSAPNPLSIGYAKAESTLQGFPTSVFDDDMLVLSILEGPNVSLESTLQIAGALRKRIHDAFPDRQSPPWLGGHESDGSATKQPHMAIVPLPWVGRKHADGHLLGIALAFPRNISIRERAISLKGVFRQIEEVGNIGIQLNLRDYRRHGDKEECQLILTREERLSPPLTLRAKTWTRPSSVWESVTPIVLDRFPKKDRLKQRDAWQVEVGEIISQSCVNIGLPKPWQVHVHHNAFLEGVPKARPQGGGFPLLQGKDSGARYQVHARIEFEERIVGPIMLGAGRFVGYGFCRPNIKRCEARRAPRWR